VTPFCVQKIEERSGSGGVEKGKEDSRTNGTIDEEA
jgi:hypothetical protein